jgi:hypothetical protein
MPGTVLGSMNEMGCKNNQPAWQLNFKTVPIGYAIQQFPPDWSEKSHCCRWFQELAVNKFLGNCVFLGRKWEHEHPLVFQKSPCSPLFFFA